MIESRLFVPTKAFLTKGVGRHKEKLTSFEMALRDAHLANFNLVRVSSIFPPHCELVDREEGLSMLQPGQVVFAVIAESSTNEPSRLVAASIGVAMPADVSHHGYICGRGRLRGGPRRVDARHGARRAVRFRAGLGSASRAVDALGRDRADHERDVHGRVRGRRPLDDGCVRGVLLRLTFAVAFTAGLLSFLSPCVLPLIPSYVGFLTGLTLEELDVRRGTALVHALWFVAGFSIIFVALGATASALGVLLLQSQVWLARVGGIVVVLFGLYLLGVLRPGFLMRERKLQLARKPLGYVGSTFVGMTFGAAWTPCIGPILGAILTLAAAQASVAHGSVLLAVYSLGLAIPFVVTALLLDRFLVWFRRFRPYLAWVERITGILLILLGLLLLTDRFTLIAGWLQGLTPEFLKRRL